MRTFAEAQAAFRADLPAMHRLGIFPHPSTIAYAWDGLNEDYTLAMDAQPVLVTDPNSSVPSFLTTYVDPSVYKVFFAPNKLATIYGEVRKGSWLDETAMFPVVEHVGEVSSYGDYADGGGHANVNTNFPQRQAYLFQTFKEYGERELERAGLARVNWAGEIDQAAATILNKFLNFTYAFGVAGLQNYGLTNDPNLAASLSPGTKAAGGVKWIVNGAINATANEVYTDIQSIYLQLVTQTGGLVQADNKLVLVLSPAVEVALTTTNSFNVNVHDLLKKNFPNLRIESSVQYGGISTQNNQGIAAGNLVQLIAEDIEGQQTGYCAFNEKMRAHKLIPYPSSWRQKVTCGTWGAVIRMPVAIASMVGV